MLLVSGSLFQVSTSHWRRNLIEVMEYVSSFQRGGDRKSAYLRIFCDNDARFKLAKDDAPMYRPGTRLTQGNSPQAGIAVGGDYRPITPATASNLQNRAPNVLNSQRTPDTQEYVHEADGILQVGTPSCQLNNGELGAVVYRGGMLERHFESVKASGIYNGQHHSRLEMTVSCKFLFSSTKNHETGIQQLLSISKQIKKCD